MSHATAATHTTSASTAPSSSPPTTADRLRAEAQKAEARGDNTVRTVTIGSKEYYVVNITGGKLGDLGALGKQAEETDNLFKAIVTAQGDDFEYLDAQGKHEADGTVTPHSNVGLGAIGNRLFEEATAGGVPTKEPDLTEHQSGVLHLYETLLTEPGPQIDREHFKAFAKNLKLPEGIQKALLPHTSSSQPFITKSQLIKDFKDAIAIYGKQLFDETIEGLPSDKATAIATYNSEKPTGSELATLRSKLNQDKMPADVIKLEEQFAVHNIAARKVRTAQHAWNALAKIVDTTVQQGRSFPDLSSVVLLPKKPSISPHGVAASSLHIDATGTALLPKNPLTACSLLASVSPKHSPVMHTTFSHEGDDVGKGTLDLRSLDSSPSASLLSTPLASGTATPKAKASTLDSTTHATAAFDPDALSLSPTPLASGAATPKMKAPTPEGATQTRTLDLDVLEALAKERAEEESVAQSSSIINSSNAKTVGAGVLTGVGALGLGLTAGPALAIGAATMATVKGVQYLRGSSTTATVESDDTDDGSSKKPPE